MDFLKRKKGDNSKGDSHNPGGNSSGKFNLKEAKRQLKADCDEGISLLQQLRKQNLMVVRKEETTA